MEALESADRFDFALENVAALDPTPSRYVASREKQQSILHETMGNLDAWAAELAHGVRNLNPPVL